MLLNFETNLNGINILENCQLHHDSEIFKKTQKILIKYFQVDSEEEHKD